MPDGRDPIAFRDHGVLLQIALLAVAYFLAGYLTLEPPLPEIEAWRMIWPASGIGLAAVLLGGLRLWPGITLGAMAATAATGGAPLHILGTGVANTLEVVLGVWLLSRADFRPSLERGREVLRLIVWAAAVATLLPALLSTGTLVLTGGAPSSGFGRISVLWWLTHANGVLVLTPLLLTVATGRAPARRGRWIEFAALLTGLAVLGVVLFGGAAAGNVGSSLVYLPFPILLWSAFRFGQLGASAANVVLAVAVMGGTLEGLGPFASDIENLSLVLTWLFVAVMVITTLMVAGVVTERERTARALREKEEHLRAVLDSTADGILVTDRHGAVSLTNRRLTQMWSLGDEEEPPGPRDIFRALAGQLENGRRFLSEASRMLSGSREVLDEIVLKDGRTLERFSAPLARGREQYGRIWSFRDISERREAEEERTRLEQQVQHAQKLESLGLLAGGIAHDFNNILLAIMGNADLAAAAIEEDSEARAFLSGIVQATQRAAELSKQMLAYSGRGRFIVRPVDLSEVVAEMANLLEVSLSKKARLEYDLARDLPAVEADVTQLRQVVMNLITNASDALGEKAGVVSVRTGAMDWDAPMLERGFAGEDLQPGRYAYLEVSDTGQGMDGATLGRIFEPFFTTKQSGRGLGLAAALGIVRGHGGAIRVTSEAGVGTTFLVLLPTTLRTAVPPSATREVPGPATEATVLVVEDEEMVRDLARRILLGAGFKVLTAEDGVAALEVYGAHRGRVDAVLLDLTMPRMDGRETMRELRALDPDLPIVLTSGYSEVSVEEPGARDDVPFVPKPYRPGTLVEAVRKALEPRLSSAP